MKLRNTDADTGKNNFEELVFPSHRVGTGNQTQSLRLAAGIFTWWIISLAQVQPEDEYLYPELQCGAQQGWSDLRRVHSAHQAHLTWVLGDGLQHLQPCSKPHVSLLWSFCRGVSYSCTSSFSTFLGMNSHSNAAPQGCLLQSCVYTAIRPHSVMAPFSSSTLYN